MRTDRVPPLAPLLVFERRVGLRAVTELDARPVGIEVEIAQVERANGTGPRARVPHQKQRDVFAAGVVVAVQVLQNITDALGFERRIAHILPVADRREGNVLAQSAADRVDLFRESEERTERRQLAPEGHRGDRIATIAVSFPSPDAVSIEVATGKLVQILDPFLGAPLLERVEPVPLAFECPLAQLVTAGLEVHRDALARREGFEVVAHR